MPLNAPKYPHSSLWPTKKEYLWLLRMEASHRGLLFTSKPLDCLPTTFTCEDTDNWDDGHSTQDHRLDTITCTKQEPSSGIRGTEETDYTAIVDSTKRRALIQCYAWLYLERIQESVEQKLEEAGAAKSQGYCAEDAVLYDLGRLWSATSAQAHGQDGAQACLGVFSDIPQEESTIKYFNISLDLTFAQFQEQAAAEGLVRFLTTRHDPALAKSLFLDDTIVYHHPYPTAIDESDPLFPAEIYPITRDYDAKDNGWYTHVMPLEPAGMLQKLQDWRPINTEADWQSLLRLFKQSPRKVFMRHKSVEDRMEFIKQHREREELERVKTGGVYTNLFLERHIENLYPTNLLQAPTQPDQRLSDKEWLMRITDQQRREGEVFEDEVAFFAQL